MLAGPSLHRSASPALHRRRSFTLASSTLRLGVRSRSGSAPPRPSSSSRPYKYARPSEDAVLALLGSLGWKLLSWAWVLLSVCLRLLFGMLWVAALAIPTAFLALTYLKIAARLRAVDEHAAFLLLNVIALQQLRTALFGQIAKGVNRAARRVIAGALFGAFAGGAWGEASLVYAAGPQVIGLETHVWLFTMVAGMVEAARYALEI